MPWSGGLRLASQAQGNRGAESDPGCQPPCPSRGRGWRDTSRTVLEPVVEVEHDRGLCPMRDRSAGAGEQRVLLARLRAVVAAKDAENAMLRAELDAARERYRRLELRVAELERRLGQDSTNSGTPPSKE